MSQNGELKKIAIDELVEDYHLYPRSEVDGVTVEEFRESLRAEAKFPPIRACSKTLRIIDGFHRKTAYERERATHVLCSLEEVDDDKDLFRRAAHANASHGRRYSVDDYATAVRLAKRLGLTREQISADFLLPRSASRSWSASPRAVATSRCVATYHRRAARPHASSRSRWTPSPSSPGPPPCCAAYARGTSTRSPTSSALTSWSCPKCWGNT